MSRRLHPSLARRLKFILVGGALVGAAVLALAQTQAPRTRPADTGALSAPGVVLPGDRTLASTPQLSQEASALIGLLQNNHYNHDAVKVADYESVIPDYMEALDNLKLFFLKSDKTDFQAKYGSTLFYNLKNSGNLDVAYKIFAVYDQRLTDRVAWITDELKKDIDLNTDEAFAFDRTDAEWPESADVADTLWRKRIKSEILNEVLATKAADRDTPDKLKQTVAKAKESIKKRYDRAVYNASTDKASELAELFLTKVAELYDPHSSYFSPEGYDDFSINIRLNLYGIGALLELDKDYLCVVKEIVPGGPADVGKILKPDDKIVAVGQGHDGQSTDVQGWKLRDIVQLIRGKKDTQVHLTVVPAGSTDSSARRDIYITRDLVKLDNAKAHAAIFDVPAADGKSTVPLGVISLPAFYGGDEPDGTQLSAARDVAELIKQLQTAGIKGLVLDLRHNGGGLLSEAIDLAGLFISRGPIVQVRTLSSKVNVDEDEDPGIAYRGALAVLVDRYSASASEIVAGALQNYGRAIVIGDTSTHGKGTVQQIVEMQALFGQRRSVTNFLSASPVTDDQKYGAAKITIQKFYLPNGSSTQRRGVVPDVILPSMDDYVKEIGESDLPHALVWDEIRSAADFTGKPLDPTILNPLLEASKARQASMEEFKFLAKNIDRFKTNQEQKEVSLNLASRLKQKDDDVSFIKAMKSEREDLKKLEYPYKEYRLAPATAPAMRAKPEDNDDDSLSLIDDDELNAPFPKVDINLRESLRILTDAVAMAKQPAYTVSGREPLTAANVVMAPSGRN